MTSMPTWDQFMAPALRVLADGGVHRARDVCNTASDELGVTDEERRELIPSGQPRYQNRALWALSYLARSGAAERPSRGLYRITAPGRELLAALPNGITTKDLRERMGYVSPQLREAPGALAVATMEEDTAQRTGRGRDCQAAR